MTSSKKIFLRWQRNKKICLRWQRNKKICLRLNKYFEYDDIITIQEM